MKEPRFRVIDASGEVQGGADTFSAAIDLRAACVRELGEQCSILELGRGVVTVARARELLAQTIGSVHFTGVREAPVDRPTWRAWKIGDEHEGRRVTGVCMGYRGPLLQLEGEGGWTSLETWEVP